MEILDTGATTGSRIPPTACRRVRGRVFLAWLSRPLRKTSHSVSFLGEETARQCREGLRTNSHAGKGRMEGLPILGARGLHRHGWCGRGGRQSRQRRALVFCEIVEGPSSGERGLGSHAASTHARSSGPQGHADNCREAQHQEVVTTKSTVASGQFVAARSGVERWTDL